MISLIVPFSGLSINRQKSGKSGISLALFLMATLVNFRELKMREREKKDDDDEGICLDKRRFHRAVYIRCLEIYARRPRRIAEIEKKLSYSLLSVSMSRLMLNRCCIEQTSSSSCRKEALPSYTSRSLSRQNDQRFDSQSRANEGRRHCGC